MVEKLILLVITELIRMLYNNLTIVLNIIETDANELKTNLVKPIKVLKYIEHANKKTQKRNEL